MTFWTKALGVVLGIATLAGGAVYLSATDGWGSVFVILALVIALLKQIIAFIGFLTTAIKFLVIFVFIAVIIGVGLLAFRAFREKDKPKK